MICPLTNESDIEALNPSWEGESQWNSLQEENDPCPPLEKAVTLLLNPHYGVREIASELGFKCFEAFQRAFAEKMGESPETYRGRLHAAWGIGNEAALILQQPEPNYVEHCTKHAKLFWPAYARI